MRRRRFLAVAGVTASMGVAGCRSMFETRSARSPPLVENRPDAVYVPSHVEGMQMVGTADAGDYRVALTYSFPHRFWLVNGDRTNKVEIGGNDSLHLMTTVWDPESGAVVPNGSVKTTITKDGETLISGRNLWPMLSQNMGVHAGDNIQLDGEGTYEVDVTVGPLSARRTGAFRDRFGEAGTASFTLDFDRATLEETSFERLTDRQGERDALAPMEMDMVPIARALATEDLPGTVVGEATSGDAVFVATRLDSPPAGVTGSDATDSNATASATDDAYLAVSVRTPYNRYPVPFTSVSATVTRDGETGFDDTLASTFDPDLGYHYGAVADLQPGDELTLSVGAPPQIARHEGYETAFFDFSEMSMTVGE